MNGQLNTNIVRRFKERFAADCIEGVLIGYAKMRADNQYMPHWFEDKLTAHLVCKMEETGFFAQKDIFIVPQAPLYSRDIIYGDGDPANAPVIDFKFGHNWGKASYSYFAEAKNLSETDWVKPNNKTVRAYHSRDYYISDGINRYLTGYYPEGFLIGYVVNGNVLGVVRTINRLLNFRRACPQIGLLVRDNLRSSSCCYLSHNELPDRIHLLRHLLLQLA